MQNLYQEKQNCLLKDYIFNGNLTSGFSFAMMYYFGNSLPNKIKFPLKKNKEVPINY